MGGEVGAASKAQHFTFKTEKKMLQTCTVVPLMLQDLLITYTFLTYKHVILCSLRFSLVLFLRLFFFRVTKNLSLLSAANLLFSS